MNNTSFNEMIYFTGVTSLGSWWLIGTSGNTNKVQIRKYPTNITTMRDGGCAGVSGTVILPANLTSMGNYTFGNQVSKMYATKIVVLAVTPPTCSIYGLANISGVPIYVPDDSVDTYKAASRWSTYAANIYPISRFSIDYPNEVI